MDHINFGGAQEHSIFKGWHSNEGSQCSSVPPYTLVLLKIALYWLGGAEENFACLLSKFFWWCTCTMQCCQSQWVCGTYAVHHGAQHRLVVHNIALCHCNGAQHSFHKPFLFHLSFLPLHFNMWNWIRGMDAQCDVVSLDGFVETTLGHSLPSA